MSTDKKNRAPDGLIDRLISLLRLGSVRMLRKSKIARFLEIGSLLFVAFSALVILEYFFYLPSFIKIGALIFLTIASLVFILFSADKTGTSDFSSFYKKFTEAYTLQNLKYAVDLALHKRNSSLRLYHSAIRKNVAALSEQDIIKKLDEYEAGRPESIKLKRNSALFATLLTIFCIISLLASDAVTRSLYAWKNFEKPNPYTYTIRPGSVTVEQGKSIEPVISFTGSVPDQVKLALKTKAEKEYRLFSPQISESQSFTFNPIKLNTGASYYLLMDGYKSELFNAYIQLRPRFESLSAKVVPPSYTGLDFSTYSYPFSRIQAYKGSKIQLAGIFNKKIADIQLVRKSTADTVSINPKNNEQFSYNIPVAATDTFSFLMKDSIGLANKNPFEFIIEPVEDIHPTVHIIQPEGNLEMKNPKELLLRYEASDDFGITSSRLNYEIQKAFSSSPEKGSVGLENPAMNDLEDYQWDVRQLNPKPRDIVTYWIEVTDNDAVSGPKSARSRTLTITFPSLTAYLDELEDKESEVKQSMDEISESHEQMKNEYERFREQLRENPQGNWEQQQSLEQVKQKQKDIESKVEELNKKFEEIRNELSENNMMSDETLKSYDELQKLMKEIDDPELLKALEELQNSLGQMSQQKLREAMENFEFNEEQYQERIKRTLELFKTLKLNSDLEKLAAALEELANQEGELSKAEDADGIKQQKQKAIQEDTRKLSDEIKKLPEDSPERSRDDVQKLQENSVQQLESVKKKLRENIERLRENKKPEKTQQQQKSIQKSFQQMANQMRDAKKQLGQRRRQVNISALQYILYSLINLSQKQEKLTQETEFLSNRSQAFVEKARIEQTITDQFNQISDSLFKVSSEIPGLSNKINEKKSIVKKQLTAAVEQLAERNKSKSTYSERESLGGINELSSMIASLIDQLQNQSQSGGGGGSMSMQQLMEQLKNMSGQQQQLNQQIQNMINDIQGNRLSRNKVDRLNQLSRQQNKIRKQLKELQQNGQLEAGDKVLSEIERMSEQMEETINDLRGGQTDRLLIERQQNILSRMLNAEKALQQRGEEKKREATPAEEAPQTTPPEITLEELQKNIRKLLNDPNYTKFSDDYQRLIEQYFELLKKLQKNNNSNS